MRIVPKHQGAEPGGGIDTPVGDDGLAILPGRSPVRRLRAHLRHRSRPVVAREPMVQRWPIAVRIVLIVSLGLASWALVLLIWRAMSAYLF